MQAIEASLEASCSIAEATGAPLSGCVVASEESMHGSDEESWDSFGECASFEGNSGGEASSRLKAVAAAKVCAYGASLVISSELLATSGGTPSTATILQTSRGWAVPDVAMATTAA